MSTGFKLHAPYLGTDPLPEQFDPEEYLDVLHLETNAGNVIIQNPLDPEDTSIHILDEYISDTPVSIGDEDELPDRLDHLWIKTVETDSTREILNAINSSGGFINRAAKSIGAESLINTSRIDFPNIESVPGLRNWFPSTVEPDLPTLSLIDGVLNIPFALSTYWNEVSGEDVLVRYNNTTKYYLSSYLVYDINKQNLDDKLLYVYANHMSLNPYVVEERNGRPEIMLTIDGFISNGKKYHISQISEDVIEYGRFRGDTEIEIDNDTTVGGTFLRINIPNVNVYSEEDGNDGINIISFVGYNNWIGKRFIITTVFKLYYDSNNELHSAGFNFDPSNNSGTGDLY